VGGGVATNEIDGKQYVATTSGVVSGSSAARAPRRSFVFALN
jgi:hypothetical protein